MPTLRITTSRPELLFNRKKKKKKGDGGIAGGKSKQKKGAAGSKWKSKRKKETKEYTYKNNQGEEVTTLFTNEAKNVSKDGKSYLVVPGVPVREQVMNTYLLPAEEIHPEDWDRTPISIGHPRLNNGSVHVENPDVPIIGYVTNTTWDPSSKRMLAEYWFDEGETMRHPEGQVILATIKGGKMLETSTAYWADEQYVSGVFNGKSYSTVHRNPKRDHIAVFPGNQLGACSIEDGCGVNRNMKQNGSCGCMQHNVTGDLPAEGKALWEKVYEENKGKAGEASAAKMAWAACKRAGWKKEGEEWVKSNNSNYECPPYQKGHLPTELLIGYSLNKGARTQAELEAAREYIQKHGITKSVWVQYNGTIKILDGNHRVWLANEFNIDQIPVRVVDASLNPMDPEAVYTEWVHKKDQGYLQ